MPRVSTDSRVPVLHIHDYIIQLNGKPANAKKYSVVEFIGTYSMPKVF